ncbi:MAG: hypothetical protein U0521_29770 [Anaerolineae bacterium]
MLDVPLEVKSVILEYPTRLVRSARAAWRRCRSSRLLAAIAAAVHDATGVWIDHLPMTPEAVMVKLREHGVGVL